MTKYNLRFNGIRIKYNGIANIVVNSEIPLNQATPDNPGENPNPGGNTETEFVDKMSSQSFTVSYNSSTKQVTFGGAAMTYQTFKNVEYYIGSGTHRTTTASSVSLSTLQSQYNMSGGTSGTTYTLYAQVISTEGNKTALKSTSITIAADVDPISTFTPTLYNDGDTILWDFYESDGYSTTTPTVYYKVNNLTEYSMNQEDILTVAMLKSKYNLAEDSDYTLSIRFGRGSTYSKSKTTTFHIEAASAYDPSKAVEWDIHTFHDIGEVYQSLHKGDKVTFVVRHGERNPDDHSSNSPILPRSQVALLAAGRTKLTGNADFENGLSNKDFKLMGSTSLRTSQTAVLLARGRGCDTDSILGQNTIDYCKNVSKDTQLSYFNSNDSLVKTSDALLTESSNWPSQSGWDGVARGAYETNYISYLNTYVAKLLDESTASINIFGSHDYNMIPFIITVARQGKTNASEFIVPDLMFYTGEQHWIAYAGGVAIIQRAGDTNHEHIEMVPIKTLTNIGGTATDGSKDYSTGVVLMRQGVTSNKLADAYKPNSGYTYTYLVNGQIQRDITTYSDTLVPYNFDTDIESSGGSGNSGTTTVTKPASYQRVAQTSTYSSLSTSDFNDAETIYKKVDVANGDRLMIMTRHTIRNSDSGKQSGALFATNSSQYINGYDGVTLIANNIYKLQGAPFNDPSTDAYFSTNVKRCVETSYLVGKLRGNSALTRMGTVSNLQPLPGTSNASSNATADQNWEAETAVIHNGAVSPYGNSSQYSNIEAIKAVPGPHCYFNDRIWSTNASWPEVQNYYKNNTNTCIQKCTEAINWLAEASHGHPFTYLTAHDLSILPFVCFATNNGNMFSSWNNDYDSNPTGWIYYCAGVAVIVHANGNWEIYPFRLSERGKFT